MLNISLILVNKINNNSWKGNMAFLTSNFYQMQKIKKRYFSNMVFLLPGKYEKY